MKSPSASPPFSVREFLTKFGTEEACLQHIMDVRFGGTRFDCPACGVIDSTFHKLAKRRAYSCAACGHHVLPTAGTILHDTRTPLTLWFYAMYLFVTTRHGVSGKELQRQLGVTYKTAYRIGMQIRELTSKADISAMLTGHVELDEAYVGGRRSGGKRGRGAPGKTIVMGLVSRDGPMTAVVIPDVKKDTLRKGRSRQGCAGRDRLDRRTLQLRLTDRRRIPARHGKAWGEGIRLLRLRDGREPPRQFGRRVLAAVQGVGAVNARSNLAKAHGQISVRVHFSREPSGARERDVRRASRGALTTLPSKVSN